MLWEKKGLIYRPSGNENWSKTHAQVPTPFFIEAENIIRVFYATRNCDNKSLISFIDVDADDPLKIIFINPEPLLMLGKTGTFDDSGVMPSWATAHEGFLYLYYIGWNVRNTVPYHNSVGLAVSNDKGRSFKRFSEGPLWDRDYKEPYFSASTCVIKENNIWKVWYLSCTEYSEINGKTEPRYHIKYAESEDGINWDRGGHVAIDYKSENEAGIVKATVFKENGRYIMLFSYRNFDNYRTDINNSYKIGYAESSDGINWHRKDEESGIVPGASGWDSEMLCYPHTIVVKEKLLLFYNGNGFGQSGFGYAEAVKF